MKNMSGGNPKWVHQLARNLNLEQSTTHCEKKTWAAGYASFVADLLIGLNKQKRDVPSTMKMAVHNIETWAAFIGAPLSIPSDQLT